MPNFLAFILLTTIAGWGDPFETSPPAPPPKTYTQTLQLHSRWNLVSWHLNIPDPNPGDPPYWLEFDEIMPGPPAWLDNEHGEVYTWLSNTEWYPDNPPEASGWEWDLNYAYYFNLDSSVPWPKENYSLLNPTAFDFTPSSAWAHDQNVGEPGISYWFFMGYAAPAYCKLSSIVKPEYLPQPQSGNPQYFDYEGPFHDLVWHDTNPWALYDLKIVKDDQGKAYIPRPGQGRPAVDQIGMLEPGKGYFLGFSNTGPYTFQGWQDWPQWQNDNYLPPELPGSGRGVASAAHFQFQPYTHWSYPIVIDTVDLGETLPAQGDEIGVLDGERCVGAASYGGEFPVVLVAWEDDIATPLEVDGYGFGNPMTFLWYDASENAEIEFVLPPTTQAALDDPVAPSNGGFGQGLYARRSLMEGPAGVTQLPQEYKLRQNFPNPFNAETVIPLELPQRSQVRLEIFNVKGQLLGQPFEHTYDAGWPKIRWNAAKLPSGIYFYRITAEGLERGGKFVDAGKMLVLK